MKNKFFLILTLITYRPVFAQPLVGFEHYYCTGSTASTTLAGRFYYRNNSGFYADLRYNYEAERTAGVSLGRSFRGDAGARSDWAWSVTPTVGWMTGIFRGLSLGTHFSLDHGQWSFSSMVQVSPAKDDGYGYSWSEVGRSFGSRFYLGGALQQDCRFGSGCVFTPGVQGQLLLGEWTFPVYCFVSSGTGAWFLFGVTREWGLRKKLVNLQNTP